MVDHDLTEDQAPAADTKSTARQTPVDPAGWHSACRTTTSACRTCAGVQTGAATSGMDKFDRIYLMNRILTGRRTPISTRDLAERMECSEPTVKRTIGLLRDQLNAPIEYDRHGGGYVLRADVEGQPRWELPGVWFNAEELQALLVIERLLEDLGSSLLGVELAPLRRRVEALLGGRLAGTAQLQKRLRFLAMGRRSVDADIFRAVASGVAERRRLGIRYHSRSRDQHTDRELSPQRLVHYRDNWYLDAWCHWRRGLRVFALDRIGSAQRLETRADDLPEDELDAQLATAYGIFHGTPTGVAVLRFSPHMAQWVSEEHWHPQQEGQWLVDGTYELSVPFGQATELVRDILRYGNDVVVVKPARLKTLVRKQLEAALSQYL